MHDLRGGRGSGWAAVRVSERPWLGIEPISIELSEELPAGFRAADAATLPLKVSLRRGSPVDLAGIRRE